MKVLVEEVRAAFIKGSKKLPLVSSYLPRRENERAIYAHNRLTELCDNLRDYSEETTLILEWFAYNGYLYAVLVDPFSRASEDKVGLRIDCKDSQISFFCKEEWVETQKDPYYVQTIEWVQPELK